MGLDGGISIAFNVLFVILGIFVGALIILIWQRSKGGLARKAENDDYKKQVEENKKAELQAAQTAQIRDFMEFDKVEDDMIVQNDGTRFVMAIRCMGINYDLMSEPEMLAVEEGFANFLNTLKFPIQLYVQARSLDLSEGIGMYQNRLEDLQNDCDKYIEAVNRAKATNPALTLNQKQQMDYEIKKKRNLLDYGADIVNYIEKMSSNRNILQRKYYIIISAESAELDVNGTFSKEEVKDVAYSDLYTRCKTIQAAITPCGIESSILTSEELAELLYIAYNKDEADIYDIKKSLDSGIYRLYSTATNVMDKKRAALEAKMQEEAIAQAEFALKSAMEGLKNNYNVDISSLTEEEQYEDDTKKEAMQIILENQDRFEPQVVDKALEDLNASMHKPLVSQEELDAAAEEVNKEFEIAQQNAASNMNIQNTNTQDISDFLTNSPINDYLK